MTSEAGTIRRFGGGGPRRIAESAGIVVDHGEGSWLVTSDGRRILDVATAMGVAAIGHAHPVWVAAMQRQAERLSACVLHTREHAEYLQRLATILPEGVDRVALYSGGAEAVEVAVRLAQSVTGHRNIISFTTGFHGKTAGVRFTGGRYEEERRRLDLDWVHHVRYPRCIEHDAVTYEWCEDEGVLNILELDAYAGRIDGVAAVIVEPVLGTAGNRPPQRRFLQRPRALCDARRWLLIVDESITGFGRLGTQFACEYFDVRPDILVLGKAIGGGYPLSGVAAPGALWDDSLFAEMSATSSSYGANPMACAAGMAVLDITGAPGFLDNVREVSRVLAAGIVELAQTSPYVRVPRGAGMMLGFDIVDPTTGELAGRELCVSLFRTCLDAGLLIVGDVPEVRLNPTLVLSAAEAEAALDSLRTAFGAA